MITAQCQKQYQAARMARDPRFDGLFYIAVKTTGIFCRPICPANPPKESNIFYYESREKAMNDGFRPCLRCRPDSAPDSFAWKGVETTAERSLKLLRDNPDLTISEISDKLGITSRYLHKLLNSHFGLSAKQYQLYSQVLFAKQLLHQTNLSIENVAHSIGFNSSRRLQAQMKKITGLTPKQIRNRTADIDTENITLRLHYRPPYNWPVIRDFIALRAISPIEEIKENSYSLKFNTEWNENTGSFTAIHRPQQHAFDVKIKLSTLAALPHVVSRIRRVLDLDADPLAITEGLVNAGLSHNVLTLGLRLPGVWSVFEAGCRAIIGQQISVKAAINQLQRIVTHVHQQHLLVGFPTPQQIADLDPNVLGMPLARKATLYRFAQCFCDFPQPTLEQLSSLKGIGPWTLNYIRMRGLSEPDLFLQTDLIITNQLKRYCITPNAAAPWQSYLTLQLWQLSSQIEK